MASLLGNGGTANVTSTDSANPNVVFDESQGDGRCSRYELTNNSGSETLYVQVTPCQVMGGTRWAKVPASATKEFIGVGGTISKIVAYATGTASVSGMTTAR